MALGNTTEAPPVQASPPSVEVFAAACVLAALGVLTATAFIVFTVKTRKIRIIKMASPKLNILLAAGCALSFASCVVWTLPHAAAARGATMEDVACKTLPWMMSFSFTLIFGPCVTKAWRVQQIFKHIPKKRMVIKDRALFAIILAMLLVDTVVLALWYGLDITTAGHMSQKIKLQVDGWPGLILTNTLTPICYSKYSQIWLTVLYVYKLAVLLYATYVSWTIRSISIPSMNESGVTTLATTSSAMLASATSAIYVHLREWPHAADVCIVLGVCFGTSLVMCLVFIPKIILLRTSKTDPYTKQRIGAQSIDTTHKSLEQIEEDCYLMTSENTKLKQLLKQKDNALVRLEQKIIGSDRNDTSTDYNASHCDSQEIPLYPPTEQTQYQNFKFSEEQFNVNTGDEKVPNPIQGIEDKRTCRFNNEFEQKWYESDGTELADFREIPREVNGVRRQESSSNMHKDKLDYKFNHNLEDSSDMTKQKNNLMNNNCHAPISTGPQHACLIPDVNMYEAIVNCPLHAGVVSGFYGNPNGYLHYPYSVHKAAGASDLASAISESYDLDNDDETFSYLSNCISVIPVAHVRQLQSRRRRRPRKYKKIIRDTISNDQYYPQGEQRGKKHRHREKNSHRPKRNNLRSREELYYQDFADWSSQPTTFV